ncbi:photosystem II cytochrome PsbV2 [Planktothrix sp. FACHB-1365]|uniref:photosystem II cytochrome PsbV2 n=1 Tax=Planktothrix sp. FACHB-1365 TaxID=2692855 RepID=UPI0016895EF0|nr:photosystem II cytochrome PsbV2 [Planktothrix sp. FACHB-1365]MBD2485146.1 photosystem II cytochrome PsbV2 [Planktothrix sp. FACHB-1365]
MGYSKLFVHFLLTILILGISLFSWSLPTQAASIDPFIRRYFEVSQPVEIPVDGKGNTRQFSGDDLTQGKALFEQNCVNCHVGGVTLQYPSLSLSLEALKGATPSRDNLNNLVAYFRNPVSYDGTDYNYWCREVSENWLSTDEAEKMAAYLLRAAEKVPYWGVQQNQQTPSF